MKRQRVFYATLDKVCNRRPVTITDNDLDQFQTTVSDFHTQPEPDSCLPTAVKNILDDLADRKDEPELRYNISGIADELDYVKNRASASDQIANRLDPLLRDAGYEVNMMIGSDFEQLQQIIESDHRSFPVCELHKSYFEDIEKDDDVGYTPEPGMDGYGNWPHVVIPFKVNDDEVLYFDPFIQFFHNLDTIDESGAMKRPIRAFNEWWSRPEKRWTLWVEPTKQQTLTASFEGE